MNAEQAHWHAQAASDFRVFRLLAGDSVIAACHPLHYLQMATEKLAKAYLWRQGTPPDASHLGLRECFGPLLNRPGREVDHVAKILGFGSRDGILKWYRAAVPRMNELSKLCPNNSNGGANVEYPWPHAGPTEHPAAFDFAFWRFLTADGPSAGRRFLLVIENAITRFDQIA